MKCPNCQSFNAKRQKFCQNCGAWIGICPECGNVTLPGDRFCAKCGQELKSNERFPPQEAISSERKHITALFADISGYTALSERLDPEELKDIVGPLIFEMAQVVKKYKGSVEKFAGDQIMALFGFPQAHEDDPVRAVRAAMEIHQVAGEISQKVREAIGQPLSVHIGINSGLTVTGQADFHPVAHHIAGDTINVASRLCDHAGPGETLVGQATYTQVIGFFSFEPLDPVQVKGKSKPIEVYRLLAPKGLPKKTHRVSGLRAELIGRRREMAMLTQAVDRLFKGTGTFIVICGEAGTGKSRLIEEFKGTLDLQTVKWIEGHAYNYTQDISYYPLINLLTRELGIEESDTPEKVREKLEDRVAKLVGAREDVAPYIASLFSLNYPQTAGLNPESWKSRLHQAVQAILEGQTQKSPTVICLEDLHWADSSFIDSLHTTLIQQRPCAIILCTYRPPLKLVSSQDISLLGEDYKEIKIENLSVEQTQQMVESVLKTTEIPEELRKYIQENVGGNPFYLEEMLNSLIESGTLLRRKGHWELTRAIIDSDIPATVHAVISDRIDRLDGVTKHLLQEASVLGRTVPYEILKKITEHPDSLDQLLSELERLDLIRRTTQVEQEFIFKHSLIQEVVYCSLLKKDRTAMHQRIGLVMEQVFSDRLPEFYETLALHFRHSDLLRKAVNYLRLSGKKSLEKYAVHESQKYYKRAFEILGKTLGDSEEEKQLLIDFLNEWAQVFYYRADFGGLSRIFGQYQEMAESLDDMVIIGIFYGWLGITLFCTGMPRESYLYSIKALELGEKSGSYIAIGLAYANLTWCCAEMGLLDQGIQYGQEVLTKVKELEPMAFFLSVGGLGLIHLFKGDSQKNIELGRILLDYGESSSDLRSNVVGYICTSYGHYTAGDFAGAMEWGKKAIELSNDPLFSVWPKLALATYFVQLEQFQEADEILRELVPYCQHLGVDYITVWAQALQGVILIAGGQYSRGMEMILEGGRVYTKNGRLLSLYLLEFTLAEIYFQMANRSRRLGFWPIVKNLGFILREVPFARRKTETYLRKTIQVGRDVESQGFIQGLALLHLGFLHRLNMKMAPARECFAEALQILGRCSSATVLQQAREALASVS